MPPKTLLKLNSLREPGPDRHWIFRRPANTLCSPGHTPLLRSRPMFALLLGLVVGILTLGAAPPIAHAEPAEYLPVRHAAYQELDALFAQGLVTSLAIHTRPLSRVDIARALVLAARQNPALESEIHFRRLARELVRELREIGWEPNAEETGPLIDTGTRDQRFRVSLAAHALGDYDETREDAHFRLRDESSLSGRFSLQLWPGLGVFEEIGITRIRGQRDYIDAIAANSDLEVALLRGEVTGRVGPVTGAIGYESHRWGPGRSGSLLLADAAGPMTSLWFQGALRGRVAVTGTVLNAVVSNADGAYLGAHRLEFEIAPKLTIGVAEAVRYSGTGIDPLYAIGIIPYTLIERIQVREASADSLRPLERANVMASADVAWRAVPGLTLYGEFLVDDFGTESGDMPDRFGYQAGFRSERPLGARHLHFLGEYTRVRNYTYSVDYGENFIYRERSLGYTLGPDVENVTLEAWLDLARDWQLRWTGYFTNKGEGSLGQPWVAGQGGTSAGLSGVVEERREVWGDVRWLPRDNVDLSVGLGFRRIANEQHVSGAEREAWLGRFAAELRY